MKYFNFKMFDLIDTLASIWGIITLLWCAIGFLLLATILLIDFIE